MLCRVNQERKERRETVGQWVPLVPPAHRDLKETLESVVLM